MIGKTILHYKVLEVLGQGGMGVVYEAFDPFVQRTVAIKVEHSAADMDPATLKKEFGKDITFWGGGCDTQSILPGATPGEVADHVRRQVDVLAGGGGFVFQQVHNIMADVPPENIVAMLDAVNA